MKCLYFPGVDGEGDAVAKEYGEVQSEVSVSPADDRIRMRVGGALPDVASSSGSASRPLPQGMGESTVWLSTQGQQTVAFGNAGKPQPIGRTLQSVHG